jgi:hypothetical protein
LRTSEQFSEGDTVLLTADWVTAEPVTTTVTLLAIDSYGVTVHDPEEPDDRRVAFYPFHAVLRIVLVEVTR